MAPQSEFIFILKNKDRVFFSFIFIRDDLPKLSVLNMSDVKIKAYNGNKGTCNFSILYPANEMPQNSFYDCYLGTPNSVLTSVILPTTITSIGYSAFFNCTSLSEFILPFSVVYLDKAAIFGCKKLTNYQILRQLVLVGESSTVDNTVATALVVNSKATVNQKFKTA